MEISTTNPDINSGSSGSGGSSQKKVSTPDVTPKPSPITGSSPTANVIKKEEGLKSDSLIKSGLTEPNRTEEIKEVHISITQKIKKIVTHSVSIIRETLAQIINQLF